MEEIKTIGVVGAGVMGRGVAQAISEHNLGVVLLDISTEVLNGAIEEIHNTIRMSGLLKKSEKTHDPDEICARIKISTDMKSLSNVDFLVENVTENIELKKSIYPELDMVCREDCVFAVNTSAISITRVASWTKRPELIVGMHFMNPVPMKPLVEVIRAYHSSDEGLNRAKEFLKCIGKKSIVVEDMPGFVSNRVLMLMVNEAIMLVQDGVSTVRDVDRIFKGCFSHPMGPLETADLIGLDTILYSLEVLLESYNDPKYRPAPLLKKMVNAGLHGKKSGEGFFKYPKF